MCYSICVISEFIFFGGIEMKKEYLRPELNVLSLVVEDNTNLTLIPEFDDESRGGDFLGKLFI